MKFNKKYLLIGGLGLFCVAVTGLLADKDASEKQQQVDLIASFYKDHLSQPDKQQASQLPANSFYSRDLEALVEANAQLCDSLSRGDDICGYGADGDVFLQTQETAPNLDFERSGFKAVRAADGVVDVSFNVYPDMGKAYDRKLRYLLVREKAGWRVDDVQYNGSSMRQDIQRENSEILTRARDLSDTANWVFHYIANDDTLDRATRFIAFPLQVCDHYGSCDSIKRDDPRLMSALEAARSTDDSRLPKPGQVKAEQNHTVSVNALDFTFRNKAWWITKIDLSRVRESEREFD